MQHHLTGSCSILSPEGIRWINALVGDESFSSLLSGLKIPRKAPLGNFEGRVNHPLPSNDMIKTCFKGNGLCAFAVLHKSLICTRLCYHLQQRPSFIRR